MAAHRGQPKRGEPNRGEPNRGTPSRGEPNRGQPRDRAPDRQQMRFRIIRVVARTEVDPKPRPNRPEILPPGFRIEQISSAQDAYVHRSVKNLSVTIYFAVPFFPESDDARQLAAHETEWLKRASALCEAKHGVPFFYD